MNMIQRILLTMASATVVVSVVHAQTLDETGLRLADAEQMRIIVESDVEAQQDFMHPNYLINAPANRVLRKSDVVAMLGQGRMASERFARHIEGVAITGNVGIVAGHEEVEPAAGSQLADLHGTRPLHRRFINVYLFEGGRWRFLARQASVVSVKAK